MRNKSVEGRHSIFMRNNKQMLLHESAFSCQTSMLKASPYSYEKDSEIKSISLTRVVSSFVSHDEMREKVFLL